MNKKQKIVIWSVIGYIVISLLCLVGLFFVYKYLPEIPPSQFFVDFLTIITSLTKLSVYLIIPVLIIGGLLFFILRNNR